VSAMVGFPSLWVGPLEPKGVMAARESYGRFWLRLCNVTLSIARNLPVLGFSQGGVMAYSLGFGEPERFAALARAQLVAAARFAVNPA